MPSEASTGVATAGRRLKRRVLWSLFVSAVLPLIVLAYVVQHFVLAGVASLSDVNFFGLHGLVFFTLLAMVGGAWLIWDLGRAVGRMAELLSARAQPGAAASRSDELATLMASLTSMLGTIERQAAQINTFTTRLDAAYKELELTNMKLRETSFRDEVTGVYNRRFFFLRIEEEMARFRRFNHPVSVVVIDIDDFKSVNDEFGHAVGDETLRDIAQLLMKHSRGINVVSRFGGDEFAVVLVETWKAGAELYAERIRRVIAGHHFSHGKVVTASFGLAGLPEDDVPTSEALFRAADDALYVAKRAGRNRVAVAGFVEPAS